MHQLLRACSFSMHETHVDPIKASLKLLERSGRKGKADIGI